MNEQQNSPPLSRRVTLPRVYLAQVRITGGEELFSQDELEELQRETSRVLLESYGFDTWLEMRFASAADRLRHEVEAIGQKHHALFRQAITPQL